MNINDLWHSTDPDEWEHALRHYWDFVQPRNLERERALDALDLQVLRDFSSHGWYDFLHEEYFCWKYTAPNRYATTIKRLETYIEDNTLEGVDCLRQQLLNLDLSDVRAGLEIAKQIRGLGTAGASGLLSLMYPDHFATVDQFVVKALRLVVDLPEADALSKMKPESLNISAGVLLISILKRKAEENNRLFGTSDWTPRKIDMVLWTYGR